jgi:PPM family protein phosphatase
MEVASWAGGKAGLQIAVGARSDTGLVRQNNEDRFAVDLSLNLFILCDGMGGQAAGEVASKLGVETILDHCRKAAENPSLEMCGERQSEFSEMTNRLASGIRRSNKAINDAAEQSPATSGMGSTVVAARVNGNVLSIAHVGDSRIYLFRGGKLRQLTQDHSLVMEQVRRGLISAEEASQSELSNVIMRALGAEPDVEVDLDELWLNEGDQVLLCSDGLTRMATDAQIAPVLTERYTAQQACERLVELANELGGEDNVTVILIRVEPSPPPSWWRRALRSILGGGDRVWLN